MTALPSAKFVPNTASPPADPGLEVQIRERGLLVFRLLLGKTSGQRNRAERGLAGGVLLMVLSVALACLILVKSDNPRWLFAAVPLGMLFIVGAVILVDAYKDYELEKAVTVRREEIHCNVRRLLGRSQTLLFGPDFFVSKESLPGAFLDQIGTELRIADSHGRRIDFGWELREETLDWLMLEIAEIRRESLPDTTEEPN